MTFESPSCVVVYNRLNYESVLAAAILCAEVVEAEAVDVSQLIHDDSQEYVWIGCEPITSFGSFRDTGAQKTHTVFLGDNSRLNAVSKVSRLAMFSGMYSQEEEHHSANEFDCDAGIRRTLIDKVCEHFEIDVPEYRKLALHASKFHDKTAELEYLAFVYKNIKHADKCLYEVEKFKVQEAGQADIDAYMQDMNAVKRNFRNRYQELKVQDGDRVRNAIYTTMNDFGYHLSLRLIKLAHAYYLNVSMGLSGTIAFSNMRRVKFEDAQTTPILMN